MADVRVWRMWGNGRSYLHSIIEIEKYRCFSRFYIEILVVILRRLCNEGNWEAENRYQSRQTSNIMATINVVFKDGVGSLNAKVFRAGTLVGAGSTSTSGSITIDTQKGDAISIGGACAGTATITVDVATIPATPIDDPTGPINHILLIQ